MPAGLLTTDAAGLVARDDVDIVVEVIGGIEPARTLILAALEHGARVVTANKALLAEDGADAVRGRREGRARPLLRGRRRRRDPDPAAAARVAGRRPGHPGARHRQRHHQLHPRQDGHHRRRLRRGARGGPGARATPRPTRPPTSRASTPPPRPRSWPASPSTPGSPPPTSTARASPRSPPPTSRRPARWARVVKLLAICERSTERRRRRRLGPRAPGDDPADAPAGQRPRGVQRGLRRGRGRRPADVLRPRRRRRARPRARCSATWSRWPATGSRAPAAPASRRTPTARCCRWARPAPATTSRIDVDDRAGVLAAVATAFAEHDVSIQTVRQEGRGDDAQLVVVVPPAPPTPRWRDRRRTCAAWTSSARSPR